MSWTLKKLDTFAGPGEIKRREVNWTLKKKLDTSAGPGEIKRREVELDPQVSPEEIMSREVELGCESWTSSLLQVVTQQRCNGHYPCDCPAQQLKQQLRSTLVAVQWRGDTALTLPLFWPPRSSGSERAVEPSLSRPLPPPHPPVPSLISIIASVDVKQNVYLLTAHYLIMSNPSVRLLELEQPRRNYVPAKRQAFRVTTSTT